MFEYKDLQEKAEWLETLSKYIEWEYPLSFQRDIDGVLALIRQMMRNSWDDNKALNKGDNDEETKIQTD